MNRRSINPEIIRTVKRNQLIRCYTSVIREYPDAQTMSREQAADHLMQLEEDGKINISFETVDSIVLCKIDHIN